MPLLPTMLSSMGTGHSDADSWGPKGLPQRLLGLRESLACWVGFWQTTRPLWGGRQSGKEESMAPSRVWSSQLTLLSHSVLLSRAAGACGKQMCHWRHPPSLHS